MSDQIPQEIVEKTLRIYDIHRTDSGQFGPASSSRESMRVALEAVLPDLQRPLLEEIERLRKLDEIDDRRLEEMDALCDQIRVLEIENKRLEVIEEAARASACSYFPKAGPQSTMEERNRAAAEAERRWRRLCDALGPDFKPDNDSAFLAMVEQLERLRAERDARPDLTAEEIRVLLDSLLGYLRLIPFGNAQWERRPALKSARAKLEALRCPA